MKGLKLIAGTFILLLIFACFISVPVFSGDEGPWDRDDDSGSNTDSDTTGNDDDEELTELPLPGGSDVPDWLSGLLFRFSYSFVTAYLFDSQAASTNHPEQVDKAGGSRPAAAGS